MLTTVEINKVLRQIFPKQNDFNESNYVEELQELFDFGINSQKKLLELVNKHYLAVMEIDASDLDKYHTIWYSQVYGEDYVQKRIKNKYWFALPGLLRIVLELEFGDKYIEYSKRRDKL